MKIYIFSVLITITHHTCVDRSPYCNSNDCTVRPGYAREYCTKTCGNCKDFCHNSHFVSCRKERKSECDAMLKDYCPLLCGECKEVKPKVEKKDKVNKTKITTTRALTTTTSIPYISDPNHVELPIVDENLFKPYPFQENLIETPAKPLNIDVEASDADEIEWIHDPSDQYHQQFASQNMSYYPEIPEPSPLSMNSMWMRRGPQFPRPFNVNPPRFGPPYFGQKPSWNRRITYPMGNRYPTTNQFNHFNRRLPQRFTMGNQMNYNPYFSPQYSDESVDLIDLVSLLGCRDRDPATCSKISMETCLARPGYYLKLCPVKCKNCNGMQCFDSVKVDCAEVRRLGGCKLPTANEYCPKSCELCNPPASLSEALSVCKDELDNCTELAESGICHHSHSKEALRNYCAKSCGYCKDAQYYMNDIIQTNKQHHRS